MTDVFDHPWLGGLFADDAARAIWSAERQMEHMLAFEAAYSRALGRTGRVEARDANAAADLIGAFRPDMAGLRAGTARDGLPVPALVKQLRAASGPLAPAVHTGTTSQDVMDTALALSIREMNDLLLSRLGALAGRLARLSHEFGAGPLIGRTRMQAAQPITVADRISAWAGPLEDHRERVIQIRPRVERVQLGGASGDRKDMGGAGADIAGMIAGDLGLVDPTCVWHATRDGIVDYASLLCLISGTLGKMGQDLCLMAQQGVDEVVLSGGGGSSAMPHKQNPILAELLVTLARFNAVQVSAMHQAMVHEQERSGSAWALEWMVLPQMAMATARSLSASLAICDQIVFLGAKAGT